VVDELTRVKKIDSQIKINHIIGNSDVIEIIMIQSLNHENSKPFANLHWTNHCKFLQALLWRQHWFKSL